MGPMLKQAWFTCTMGTHAPQAAETQLELQLRRMQHELAQAKRELDAVYGE